MSECHFVPRSISYLPEVKSLSAHEVIMHGVQMREAVQSHTSEGTLHRIAMKMQSVAYMIIFRLTLQYTNRHSILFKSSMSAKVSMSSAFKEISLSQFVINSVDFVRLKLVITSLISEKVLLF